MFRTFTPRANWTLIAGLVSAVLAWLLVWYLLTEPGRQRQRAAAAELAGRQASASASAGEVAANAIAENADADAATDQLGRNNSDAIDRAPDAGVRVPGVFDAQRRGLCERAAYRGDPLCVQPASKPAP